MLSSLRHILTDKIKLLLYNALFATHITYCTLIWGTTSCRNIQKICTLQKRVLRYIANVVHDAHTKDLFSKYGILPFQLLYDFTLLLKYKKSLKQNETTFLALCALTKSSDISFTLRNRSTWLTPFSRTCHGRNRLKSRIATLLGDLENDNIDIDNLTREKWKTFLLNRWCS